MDLQAATDLLDRLHVPANARAARSSDRRPPPKVRGSWRWVSTEEPLSGWWAGHYLTAGARPVALVTQAFRNLPDPHHLGHQWPGGGADVDPSGPLLHADAPNAAHRWDPDTRPNMRPRLAVVDVTTAPASPAGVHAVTVGALAADRLAGHLDALAGAGLTARDALPWRREADTYRAYVTDATGALDALAAPWADLAPALPDATPIPVLPRGFAAVRTT